MPAAILITRPEAAAKRFSAALSGRVGDAKVLISPVMDIVYRESVPDLARIKGLIFTSQNGVRGLARLTPERDVPCYCVGEKTAHAARTAGFEAHVAGEDAEALVNVLRSGKHTPPFLHVRGAFARGDVANRLSADGLETHEVVLYDQLERSLSEQALALLDGAEPVIVPLFSPRCAAQFAKQHKGNAPLWIVAMSEAVAQGTAPIEAEQLVVAKAPTQAAMVESVARLIAALECLEDAKGAQ